MTIAHETLTFERIFDASPNALFDAYLDPRVREIWSAPTPTAEVKIDQSDVRTGGEERARCGSKGDLRWLLKVKYHLVRSNQLISFTEELWEDDQILTVALITFAIEPSGQGAKLKLTDQITSFVGPDGVSGHLQGYSQALDNLEKTLAPTRNENRQKH